MWVGAQFSDGTFVFERRFRWGRFGEFLVRVWIAAAMFACAVVFAAVLMAPVIVVGILISKFVSFGSP